MYMIYKTQGRFFWVRNTHQYPSPTQAPLSTEHVSKYQSPSLAPFSTIVDLSDTGAPL